MQKRTPVSLLSHTVNRRRRQKSRLLFIFAALVTFIVTTGVGHFRGVAAGQQSIQKAARDAARAPKQTPTQAGQNAARQNPEHPEGKTSAISTAITTQATANPRPVLATVDFDLLGLVVTATPATQTVPKNTQTAVLTSVQVPFGVDPAQVIAALPANYRVKGELTGPSLTNPLTVEAAIGQPLQIPALTQAGDHLLQNLRVVDTGAAGMPVIAQVTPDAVGIVVIEQLLVSQVKVEEMTYDQIAQSGIAITDDSYKFFNFTLALATSSQAVNISLPVAIPPKDLDSQPPIVGRPQAPLQVGANVPRFEAVGVMLEVAAEAGGEAAGEIKFPGGTARIPGVVVFPGRVGFLNQFFEAIVIVTNGAPQGTPLVVRNLRAKVVLPDNNTPANPADDPLRIATTQTGGQVTELELHGLGADGKYGTADDTRSFAAGQTGQASFLLEGLKEGLHAPNFLLEGTLEGLPTGPVTVRGEVQGAVLVRDASFAVTFTHPSVVRAGQEYELGMTVYNSGSRDILGAVARLNANSISGAQLLTGDSGERPFATTIIRKGSSTVVWRLRSNTTGQVTASYAKVGTGVEAGLALSTGVGDRNAPLSPDSLLLPYETKYLPSPVIEAGRALLGQAWGIAKAPRGSLPEGVLPIDSEIVFERAREMGMAGLRVKFGEAVQVSLLTLLRDWLGELQATPDAGFADAQRDTPAGYGWFDTLGKEMHARLAGGQTAASLHREIADAESPRSPFISALITHTQGPAAFAARVIDPAGKRVGFGTILLERFGELRGGASMTLDAPDGSSTLGQLLLVSRPADGNSTIEWTALRSSTIDLSVLVPASGGGYRQLVYSSVSITQGNRYRVVIRPGGGGTPALEQSTGGAFTSTATTATVTGISEPAPRLLGVVQASLEVMTYGDNYGRLVGVLFSKPMQRSSAETASRYQIGGGELIGSNPVQMVGLPIGVDGAGLNFGDRFVFLRLNSSVGPYIRRILSVSGLADTRGVPLVALPAPAVITPTVSPEAQPPGAYLTGRVILADGTPVANAPVVYSIPTCSADGGGDILLRRTDSQGRYQIDYVRNATCGGPVFTATNPANSSVKKLSTPVTYDGQHLVMDLVFVARGNVEGVIQINNAPAAQAFVKVIPQTDTSSLAVVQADAQGRYRVTDLPVGAVSVLAVGAGSQSSATGINAGTIAGPGQTATVNVTLQSLAGTIRGRVTNPDQSPAVGALVVARAELAGVSSVGGTPVGYAFAGRDGSFTIANLPVQTITLEVTDVVNGLNIFQAVPLTPTTPEASGVVITLPGYGTVSGKVVDDAGHFVPQAIVSSGGSAVVADALGNYTLGFLRAGTQTIFATDAQTGAAGSVAVTVTQGGTLNNVNITVTRPGTITGQVFAVNSSGQSVPVQQALVSHDGQTRVETDAQGRYTIRNVGPNRLYKLRFVHPNGRLGVNFETFVLPGETITRNATFRSASVRGRITQPDGVTGAVADVTVFALAPHSGPLDFGSLEEKEIATQSAADGSYLVDTLNPGKYRVRASNSFFPTRVSKGGTLAAGEEQVCNITLVGTLGGKIQGRVYQSDGVTAVGANINVTLGGAFAGVTVKTNQTGNYEFPEVFADGGYTLTATNPTSGLTAQVFVSVQQNKDVVADIRLLGRGNLRVRVIDGAGNPVTGGSVTVDGTAHPRDHRFTEITSTSGGTLEFTNLSEGRYAITATHLGLAGRVEATVPGGAIVEAIVQLQASGAVEGRVLMADGTTPVPFADVFLTINNRRVGVTLTTDVEGQVGKFRFENVPTGEFTLDTFDNRTARTGRASGRVNTQSETATVDIRLVAQGAVTGVVTANGTPVDHALVQIAASGVSLLATTTADGRYRFTGIPVGPVNLSVTNGPGGTTGQASGQVTGTTEPLPDTIINIALQPSVTVIGTIYKLGGIEPMIGARVRLTAGARVMETTSGQNGAYRLEFVPLGALLVRAEAPTGFDRGEAPAISATQPGATHTVNITLAGTGAVAGIALDNNNAPLTSGTVTLTNTEFGSSVVLSAPVQSNGRYEIRNAPAGPCSLKLVVPNRTAVGVASLTIVATQTLEQTIKLEDAGTVTGTVKKQGGAIPAFSADVQLTLVKAGATFKLLTHTNAQGVFTFENVPLGSLSVMVTDVSTGGVAIVTGLQLATNGQTLNVGEMVLDNTPIQIESVTPADGASAVARNSTVTVTFSEPALASSVSFNSLRLLKGAASVGVSVTLAADGRAATLTPTNLLDDFTSYTVVVTTDVTDRVGLRLANEFRSSFVTRDETPPVVTNVSPASGATNIPINTVVAVTFNEAIVGSENLDNVVRLSAGTIQVAGSVTLDSAAKVATFTPSAPLADSTLYTVTVTGQKDLFNNTQANVFTSSFTTQDLTPPVIDPLPIDGTRQGTLRPVITAAYRDTGSGINASSVVLTLDGVNVTAGATVTSAGLSYQPPAALTTGAHALTVQVADNAGNQSAIRTASFTIDNANPVISSFTIGGQPAVSGMTVTTTLQPTFSAVYADDTGVNTTATRLSFGAADTPMQQVAATVMATTLTYTPPASLVEGLYVAELVVVDNTGNQTSSGQIQFRIDVDAPEITTVAPATGNQHGGTVVTLTGNRLLNSNNTAPSVRVGGFAARIVSATAGATDTVVIATPAGAPGVPTIFVTTDRGTGTKAGAFTYEADPKTPFAVESDTRLLWRLDEAANGTTRILDAGPLSIDGTASSASLAIAGRFAGARSLASITADAADFSALDFGNASFTVECWVKTSPVTRSYTLVGKSQADGINEDYRLTLNTSGSLSGSVFDTGGVQWIASTASTINVQDNQWHYVAMVVDRATNKMFLYVDGVERVNLSAPPTFGAVRNGGHVLRAGHWFNFGSGSGPFEFSGSLDEIRVSSMAHSADTIQKTYLGVAGTLGLVATSAKPQTLARGETTEVVLSGYNLADATAVVTDAAGAVIPSQLVASSATEIRLQISPDSNAAVGIAQIALSSPAGSATLSLRILDLARSQFTVESDTRLLWRLDEAANGTTRILDAGPLSIDGTASSASLAIAGRFAGARSLASITADAADFNALDFGAQSFTVETWVKTLPVDRRYVLVGKNQSDGNAQDFRLWLAPSGALGASVVDTGGVDWTTTMPPVAFDVDDNQWHHVAMVVDRATNRMAIYVDGAERAGSTAPTGFGAIRNGGHVLRAGHWFNSGSGSGPLEFTGSLDEIRVSSSAHDATRILSDYSGISGMRVASYSPKEVARDRAASTPKTTTVTVIGDNLDNITARVLRNGLPINVSPVITDSSYTQTTISLAVASSEVLGSAQLVLSKPGQPDIALNIEIVEQSQLAVESDTRLLWRLDETANGATRIFDAGPLSIDGNASNASLAIAGRFGGGRSLASITADTADFNSLDFAAQSFTVETWLRTSPVDRRYVLVGKNQSDGNAQDFRLWLAPSGALGASVVDTGGVDWTTTMPPVAFDVDDNQWHHVAMVVDRATNKMLIYVDGGERVASTAPANFGAVRNGGHVLRAGHWFNSGGGSGPLEFPGALDEIRVSSTAHSADKVATDFFGYNQVRVTSVSPTVVQRGTPSIPVTFLGSGLANASVTINRPGVSITGVTGLYNRLDFLLTVADTVTLGALPFTVTDATGQTTAAEISVVDQKPFVNDPAGNTETILLWHLDETNDGSVLVGGSGDPVPTAVINGTASSASRAVAGRFSGGRSLASITADSSSAAFNIGAQSFTVETWVKTLPVDRRYVLVGKNQSDGNAQDFRLWLAPSGALGASVVDTGGVDWTTTMPPTVFDVDDNQWHHVAMVVDRATNRMAIYVDGLERAATTAPANFGAVRNGGQPLRAGHWFNSGAGSGPLEFPGNLDEIRLVNFARTAAQISDTWFGTTTTGSLLRTQSFWQQIVAGLEQAKPPILSSPLLSQPLTSLPPPPSLPPPVRGIGDRSSRATGGGKR